MAIRILVTGVNGQLAQSLAERAAGRNAFELVRVGRPILDLERPDSILRAVTKVTPDVIVNAAAYTAVDKAEDERELATRVNSEAPGILAWAARATGARLVHVSTDYVYDGRKTSPYIETDRVNPLSVYGRTKLEGEERVRAEYGNHIILRTAWLYSPFSHNFVRTILRLSETRCHLTVVNDQRGTPTSALDLADAILAIVSRWRKDPQLGLAETYHCAGTGETTWFGLARQVLATSREAGGPCAEAVPILSPQWPAKAARPSNSCLDCTKLARDFGWQAPGWQSSLRDVVLRLVSATENATA
jgi:dTDP-4-dehydrorhamnose reductase